MAFTLFHGFTLVFTAFRKFEGVSTDFLTFVKPELVFGLAPCESFGVTYLFVCDCQVFNLLIYNVFKMSCSNVIVVSEGCVLLISLPFLRG